MNFITHSYVLSKKSVKFTELQLSCYKRDWDTIF